MRTEQLTFSGGSVSHPAPAPVRLTERQRDLMRVLRFRGEITTAGADLFFIDGGGALRRLERLGLVCHVARGRWEAAP